MRDLKKIKILFYIFIALIIFVFIDYIISRHNSKLIDEYLNRLNIQLSGKVYRIDNSPLGHGVCKLHLDLYYSNKLNRDFRDLRINNRFSYEIGIIKEESAEIRYRHSSLVKLKDCIVVDRIRIRLYRKGILINEDEL